MRLAGVELVVVRLALREPIRSARLVQREKTTLFVRVVADGRSGWGECAAYPGAHPPDASVSDVEPAAEAAARRLLAASPGGELPDPRAVATACRSEGTVLEQSAVAALEMAVVDVTLQESGQPLAALLGATRARVAYGALVGIPEDRDPQTLIANVGAALSEGAARVRLKIEPGWEAVPVSAARQRFPEAVLQADANGSFLPSDAPLLRSLDRFGLRCLEQPFGPDDLEAHRDLAASMATPIALDESLSSLEAVGRALAMGAAGVACLKPGRLGGLFAAIEAASTCAASGVDCFVGGFFESGLGRAANAALAGRPEFGLPGDVGPSARYLDADPFTSLPIENGTVVLSSEGGIGVAPRASVLGERTVRRRWIPR